MDMEITETFNDDLLCEGMYNGYPSEMVWQPPQPLGLPCIIWIECSGQQPRNNLPRIKFARDKKSKSLGDHPTKIVKGFPVLHNIPLIICDKPYIPNKYNHLKHNLTQTELNILKEWVKKNKELLLSIGDGSKPPTAFYDGLISKEITETIVDGFEAYGEYCGNPFEMSWSFCHKHGLPCIIWIEENGTQPRTNHPRIKFASDKTTTRWSDNKELKLIPLMICDDPYIPDSHKHIPHNLTEDDLNILKKWVKTHKKSLFKMGEGLMTDLNLLEKLGFWPPKI